MEGGREMKGNSQSAERGEGLSEKRGKEGYEKGKHQTL